MARYLSRLIRPRSRKVAPAIPARDISFGPGFFEQEQFLPLPSGRLAGLRLHASECKCTELVEASIEAIRKAHGDLIKCGHLFWIVGQIAGHIPADAIPPACVPGDGLSEYFERFDQERAAERETRAAFFGVAQFEPATQDEISALHDLAIQLQCPDLVEPALRAATSSHGLPLKRGQVWWIRAQLAGEIPWSEVAPACVPGHGLAEDPRAPLRQN